MNYTDWVNTVCALLEYTVVTPGSATPTGTAFDTVWPQAVAYTENRMQRDIDFLATITTNDGATINPGARLFTYPTDMGHFVVVSEIIPIWGTSRLVPLEPVSRPFLDYFAGDPMPPVPPTTFGPPVIYKAFANSPYAIQPTDGWVIFDATGGNCSGVLPLAASYPYRLIVLGKDDVTSNTVTATPSGSDSVVWVGGLLISQGQTVTLKSDGISRWIATHQVG